MKKNIFLVLITAIICISSTAFAVTTLNANQITYTNSNNEEILVSDALDSLYTAKNTTIANLQTQLNNFSGITVQHCNGGHFVFSDLKQKYSKLKITSFNGTSTNYTYSLLDASNIPVYSDIVVNQEYSLSDIVKSSIVNSNGWICAYMHFYN